MSSGAGGIPPSEALADSPESIDSKITEFEEIELIGSGGNADVTKQAYRGLGPDIVAIKQPRMQGTIDSSMAERFIQEAKTWDKLDDHQHIVGVLDYGTDPLPWIALEYMNRGSLADRLEDISITESLWINYCVARAVRHAHRRGVAHLDLKPANVLFTATDSQYWDTPKVADWGLAKMLFEHSQSVEGLSPQYAAPEQFDSDQFGPPDDLTDVYSIGALLYVSIIGKPPFTGSPTSVMQSVLTQQPTAPSELVDGLPTGTDDVVLTALAKQKEDRYESVLDLRRDIETLIKRSAGETRNEELIAEGATPSTDRSVVNTPPASSNSTEQSNNSPFREQTDTRGDDSTSEGRRANDQSTFETLFESDGTTKSAETVEQVESANQNWWLTLLVLGPVLGLWIGGATHWINYALGIAVGMYGMHRDLSNLNNLEGDWGPIENKMLFIIGMVAWIITVPYYLFRRYRKYGL